MSYDTIMNLDFYIFENILDHYTKILEDRKKEEEEEMKKHGYDENKSPEQMMKQAQKNMPTPKLPSISMPKY